MLVGTSLWIGALFTYITFGMNISAVNETSGLISWVMFALIGGMLVWLAFWTFRVYRATKEAIASSNKGSK
jgi:predicted lipid-binding transport protein (Tim44 family)